jgi:hypothetical protein
MQIKKQIQGAAVAIALFSIGLTAVSAEARPWRHHHRDRWDNDRSENIWRNRDRDRDREGWERRDRDWNDDRYDFDRRDRGRRYRSFYWDNGRLRSRIIYNNSRDSWDWRY